MRLIWTTIFLAFLFTELFSQETPHFDPPVKIPMYLSGNFGEIRPDHPHSGIDIKTQGVTGHKVYAAADGYISRIKVQSGGYGYSLYIDHPGGYTTQYGHLERYRADIEEYVKKVQYAQQSFTVDIYPPAEQFRISRGDFIALSGNSGSSAGPHLHFEIRTSADQVPTNVLQYAFPIQDDIAPRFFNLLVYPVGEDSQVLGSRKKLILPVIQNSGSYHLKDDRTIGVNGDVGFGTEVFDYLNGSSNRCGVYLLDMQLDGRILFSLKMDRFTFAESRYINAHADYGEIVDQNMKAHRLFRLPNDRFSVYEQLQNNGIIHLEDTLLHTVSIHATDVAGNSSGLEFRIRKAALRPMVAGMNEAEQQIMKWDEANRFSRENISLSIPAKSLYEDIVFTFSTLPATKGLYSEWFSVHSEETPLHTAYTLKIIPADLPRDLYAKALIVTRDKNARLSAVGGEADGDFISVRSLKFGEFSIAVDTLAPVITPVNISKGKDMRSVSAIKFTATDELSGIRNYRCYIDSKWVLMAYDAKNNLLSYSFDEQRLEKNRTHELELYVTDNKGNTSLFHTFFTW